MLHASRGRAVLIYYVDLGFGFGFGGRKEAAGPGTGRGAPGRSIVCTHTP